MTQPENHVLVELYDYALSQRSDARKGRVVRSRTLTIDQLVDAVVARRSDLNAATLKMAYQLLHDVALDELANGASVQFGLATHRLGVKGVFCGDGDAWDDDHHHLVLESPPTSSVRKAIDRTRVKMRGRASTATVINTITDLATGSVNQRLTPGGGLRIAGTRVKIVGDDPQAGVTLVHVDSGHQLMIGASQLMKNHPRELLLVLPRAMTPGSYRMTLVSAFSGTQKPLIQSVSYSFPSLLTV